MGCRHIQNQAETRKPFVRGVYRHCESLAPRDFQDKREASGLYPVIPLSRSSIRPRRQIWHRGSREFGALQDAIDIACIQTAPTTHPRCPSPRQIRLRQYTRGSSQ